MLFIEVNLNKSDNEIAPNQFVVRNVTKYSGLSHNITSLNASVTGLVITVSFILTEYWKFLRIYPEPFIFPDVVAEAVWLVIDELPGGV